MFAVIETGGKQYKVQEGDLIDIEKLAQDKGSTIEFPHVLMVGDKDKVEIGQPFVKNAKVTGELINQTRGDKVIAFKQKRCKGYKKKIGHRQAISVVKIAGIKL